MLRLFPTRERDELEAVFNESLTVEYEILSWGAGDATLLLLVHGQVAFRATQVPSILGRLRSLSVICLLSLADPGLCDRTCNELVHQPQPQPAGQVILPSGIWSTVEFDRGACGATSATANQISVYAVLLHTDAGTPIADAHVFIPVMGCVPVLDSGESFLHGDGPRERGPGRGDSLRWIEIQ